MLLYCNFEEVTALAAATERVLAEFGGRDVPVVAPPQALVDLEQLAPRFVGDISIETLDEQRSVQRALELLVEDLSERMQEAILLQHAAAEAAVMAYFDYAHVLTVLDRNRRLGAEMSMLIEVMTGGPVTAESARTFSFPD